MSNEYPQRICDYIKGERKFTIKASISIEKALNINIEGFFFKIQANHDIYTFIMKEERKKHPDLSKLSKGLFWDTRIDKINWIRNKEWVIQRAFEYGNDIEIKEIIRFYGIETIKQVIPNIKTNGIVTQETITIKIHSMNLHYETVSPLLKETLQKLVNSPIFKDFTLIGGTCLSLQLGHRRSIDIDLFTDIDYGTMNTKEMKEFIQRSFPYSENTDSLDTSALGYTLYMGDSPIDKIKVDFFYTEKFIFPIQEIDHIRIADIREIAAMKLSAITEEEPRQKDFWDIHELNENIHSKI